MKVSFFLDNERLKNVDFSNPFKGNPGIGGTQYMIWTISCYLNKLYDELDITILAPIIDTMPKDIKCIKCKDTLEALNIAKDIESDIFVFRGPTNDKRIYNLIDELKIKSIMWSHNFEGVECLEYASNCKYLKRNICVSKEQYDRIIDHKIITKTTYIYNCLDFSIYENKNETYYKENIVCYMGGLDKAKGFHKLAEVWKDIKKQIPDAKLHIIGGANLYNTNMELGKYNISDKDYEEYFIKYLLDSYNKIDKDVVFKGVLNGKEKLEAISNAKVGVVNPTGEGETFCISAIEFEALGVPVVSAKTNGLLNTVKNNESGILVKSNKELSKAIITLLKDEKKNNKMSKYAKEYVKANFDIYIICSKWKDILEQVYNDKPQEIFNIKENYFDNYKWLRQINKNLKTLKVFSDNPSILEYRSKINKLRYK